MKNKDNPAPTIVFYPDKYEAWGWIAAAFLYGTMFASIIPSGWLALAVFAFFIIGGCKKLFFPTPLCTLTPDNVLFHARKNPVPYKKILSFYTCVEPAYASMYGLPHRPVENLGFRILGEGLYIFPAHRLSDKDKERLIAECKKRRLPYTGRETNVSSSFPFARFFKKRRKK